MGRIVALALGVVFVMIAASAMAEELALPATKDMRMMGHPDEANMNGGSSTRLRAVGITRSAMEVPILDFDHAAIKDFLEKNKDKKVTAKVTFVIREVAAGTGKFEAATIDSAVDWTEGAGNQAQAAKGECCFTAAQFDTKKWATPDGKEVDNFRALVYDDAGDKVKTVLNSKGVEIGKDDADKTVEIELDAAFVKHVATDANCRGLFLFHRDKSARIDIYSREQNQKQPKLVLKAE